MTTQPDALRLADELDAAPYSSQCTNAAAAELRRLHEANAELLEALKWYVENDETNEGDDPLEKSERINEGETWNSINAFWIEGLNKARAAIAKGELK
jgi:hypothetical protein